MNELFSFNECGPRPRRAMRRARDSRMKFRRRSVLEPLETRALLASNITIGASNAMAWVGSAVANDVTVSLSAGVYTISDPNDTIDVTNNGSVTVTGSTTNTVTLQGVAGSLSFDNLGGNDTYNIQSVGLPTTIDDTSGEDGTVDIGDSGSLSGIDGPISISATGLLSLNIDDSADTSAATATLSYDSTNLVSDFNGPNPDTISFVPAGLSAFQYSSGTPNSGATTLIVDFSGGNPLPTSPSGTFTDQGQFGADNVLSLQGEMPQDAPFTSETVTPQSGNLGSGAITLSYGTSPSTSSTLDFGNLQKIDDTTPATNDSFIAPSSARVVDLENGPSVVDGLSTDQTDTIASGDSPLAFNSLNFANKANVTVDLTQISGPTLDQGITTGATGLDNLNILVDADYHTITIPNTPADVTTTLDVSGSGNTLDVENTTGPLVINNTDTTTLSTLNVGDNGLLSGIAGAISITGTAGMLGVNIEDSADTGDFTAGLSFNTITSEGELSSLGFAPISYEVDSLNVLNITAGSGTNLLTVDFATGNPIPGNVSGLSFNGGSGDSSELDFQGGFFTNEIYTAYAVGQGKVDFYDATGIDYTTRFSNLKPLNDTVAATNYTFIAPVPYSPVTLQGYVIDLGNGPLVTVGANTYQTATISSPATPPNFELVNYANKTNVTLNLTEISEPNVIVDTQFVDDNSITADLQSSLTVNMGTGNDTAELDVTAPGVASSLNMGSGDDLVTVVGTGLATGTPASSLAIDGATGMNTLQVDARGTTANLSTPGTVQFGDPVGGPSFTYTNFSNIQELETNQAPTLVTPATPAITIAQGQTLADGVVASFTDADAIENANSYTATINWGDGTVAAPDFGPGTIVFTGTSTVGGAPVADYSIAGTHRYAAGGSYSIGAAVSDLGGTFTSIVGSALATTQLDSLATVSGPGAIVDVNALAAGTSTPVTATAGTPMSTATLVTFTDGNAPPPAADYSASINWGDGSPVAFGTISLSGTTFTVMGSHNFAQAGNDTVGVLIVGDGQQLTMTTPATVVDPLSISPTSELTANAGTPTGPMTLASFTATPIFVPTAYNALVDWGDGSTPSVAAIDAESGGSFDINTSGHTYAQGGSFALSITMRNSQGFVVGSADPAITVGVTLGGRLSPQSDTGVSDSDGITDDATPTFVGSTTPGTTIEVFATNAGSSATPGAPIAVGSADSSGSWSATVVNRPMTDGSYSITAEAVNSFGTVLGTTSLGTVVIDTVAPVITAATFDRFTDTLTITYQGSLSGLAYDSVANGSFYHMSASQLSKKVPVPKLLLPTSITITPGAAATDPEVVSAVFNHGHTVRGGRYTIVIDSGVGDSGIHDVAGNALDGNFYGVFPSGDGLAGGDFVASIATYHDHVLLAPVPAKDGYVPPGAAVDPPAGSLSQVTSKHQKSAAVHAKDVASRSAHEARVTDQAIESLTWTIDGRRHG